MYTVGIICTCLVLFSYPSLPTHSKMTANVDDDQVECLSVPGAQTGGGPSPIVSARTGKQVNDIIY